MYNRGKRWNPITIILFALLLIGIVVGIARFAISLILPIVIIGGIFLLYKYPPSFLGGRRGGSQSRTHVTQSQTSAKPRRDRPRSKTVPFRVIEGGKDDDDIPKYH
ncbi:hypothetical protein [Paenibacillus paeoniae]|uniref:DUF2207 domain-containing protein n=1 Tax=Paenibacillus paeoniae TaxID=2292705 RepID=A0A371PMC6_9BACL|nr:hypothetical protein [Paenibacillus paeoniae]REK77360.1 hypothetical protein DX130_10275 [Paenibacillus paeoniae]